MENDNRELIIDEARKELARRIYSNYVDYVHEGRWKKGKAVLFLCNEVQEFIETKTDNAYDVLVISMPPQHGKSMTITETLPSWYLGKNPFNRVIEISYNEDFAKSFGKKNRAKIKQFGNELFGLVLGETSNIQEFDLPNEVGGMISRGVLSGVTGKPCELMVIDDPVKNRKEADSRTYRESIWAEWNDSFKSRLAAGAKVIIIQTRWHKDDFAGRIIKNEKNVKVINLTCEAEEGDILGRKKGQALCPEIGKDDNWLKSFKESYTTQEGSRSWSALFQGNPTIDGGNIFKRQWFKYYDTLPKMGYKTISVDATFKDKENNDFVSITTWGKRDNDFYLMRRTKKRLDFPNTLIEIKKAIEECSNYNSILIEDKANGPAIISMLMNKYVGIIPIEPEGGKEARANAIAPIFESGHVYLPNPNIPGNEWVNDYIEELIDFPNTEHDDDVDSTTQALNKLKFINADILSEKEEEKLEYKEQRYMQGVKDIAGSEATQNFINYW